MDDAAANLELLLPSCAEIILSSSDTTCSQYSPQNFHRYCGVQHMLQLQQLYYQFTFQDVSTGISTDLSAFQTHSKQPYMPYFDDNCSYIVQQWYVG